MERFNDGIIDFSSLKKQKEEKVEPLFKEPATISLEDAEGKEVQMDVVMNLVMDDGRQVLVVYEQTDEESGNVAIVEPVIVGGQLAGIKGIESEEEYNEIADQVQGYLEQLPETTVNRKDV